MFDLPLHDTGDFDAVTNVWFDVTMAVTLTGIKTYDDGVLIKEDGYGFYTGDDQVSNGNLAYDAATQQFANPLNSPFQGFDFGTGPIYLGVRADKDPDRHFLGKMALVNIYDYAIFGSAARCLFRSGDAALPDPHAIDNGQSCFDDPTWADARTGDTCEAYVENRQYCPIDADADGRIAADACPLSCDSCPEVGAAPTPAPAGGGH
jgi:hypothetical protein